MPFVLSTTINIHMTNKGVFICERRVKSSEDETEIDFNLLIARGIYADRSGNLLDARH